MHLLGTYRSNPDPRHAGDFLLILTDPATGAEIHRLSTREIPPQTSLRATADAWSIAHGHTLEIDHHSLTTEP